MAKNSNNDDSNDDPFSKVKLPPINLNTPRGKRRLELRRWYKPRFDFWVRNGYLPEEADTLVRFGISLSDNRVFVRGMVRRRKRLIDELRRQGMTGSNTEEGSKIFEYLWKYYIDTDMDTQITKYYIEKFGIKAA